MASSERRKAALRAVDEVFSGSRAAERGVVVRVVNGARSFQLSETSKTYFASRIRYGVRRKLEDHFHVVHAYLDTKPEIGRDDAATLLDVAPNSASRILGELAREGRITPVANARGKGVRYRLAR